ncbi:MAG TPA: mechanosensitive ion channel family protein [Terriglobia bacterium]|nr:mechanosensitive ion channel family protein [Terriglobia bacterium]
MIEHLARALHMNNTIFYLLSFGTLIISSLLLGFALNRLLHYWEKRVGDGWGQIFFSLLESLPMPLLLIASLYLGLESLPLSPRFEHFGSKLVLALVILVMMYFPAKVIVLALRRVGQKEPSLLRVTQPAALMVHTLFALLGTIIFLENLGVSLTAVWTTLGVGSVAVALALQETLSNFFSGLYLLADRPVNPNDYIKLDSNQEGYVLRIGWRSTVLRTLNNNYVVIPNSTLAKAIITNYSAPETRMCYTLPVSVLYGTDPNRVEKVLLEAAHEALRDGVEGLLANPAPSVAFIPGFGQSSLDFSLSVQLRQFTDQYPVQSELRKRILKKFQEAGIEMPFPTRTLVLDKSTKDLLRGGSQS